MNALNGLVLWVAHKYEIALATEENVQHELCPKAQLHWYRFNSGANPECIDLHHLIRAVVEKVMGVLAAVWNEHQCSKLWAGNEHIATREMTVNEGTLHTGLLGIAWREANAAVVLCHR